jgi:hypothetical protein
VTSREDINNQKLLNEELKETKKNAEEVNNEFAVSRDVFYESAKAMGRVKNQANEAARATSKLESIAQKLSLDAEELVIIKDKELENLQKQAIAASEQQKIAYTRLVAELGIKGTLDEQKEAYNKLDEKQQELLAAGVNNFEQSQIFLDQIKEEVATREKINKSLGLTGGFIKGINEIAGEFSKVLNLDKVQKDMEKFSKKYEGNVSRIQVLGVGIVSAYKNAAETLTDPAFLLGNLIKGFKAVEKEQVEFARLTGEQVSHVDTLNLKYLTSADYIKAATDLTKEFGLNAAAVFTDEDITEVASMTQQMGLAGKEAANLARLSKINGNNIEAQNEAIIDGINSSNTQNKTFVAHGVALRDIANTSEGIAISYAGYPDKLGAAATAAAGLGMNLAEVDKIANSLLDFQSSIEAEMEAELLTGRQLNLEKARELALANDLEGVAKELAAQGVTSAEFSKMNRVQQEAQAKALGMNRDEMAKMLLQQEIGNDLSGKGLNAAQKATLEDLKRQTAQDKFNKSIEKLQQSLAPIVQFFANILSHMGVIYTILGSMVVLKIWKNIENMGSSFKIAKDGASTLFSYMKKEGGGIGGMFKSIGNTIKDKWMGGMGKIKSKAGDWYDADSPQGKMIRSKGGTSLLGDAADKTQEIQGQTQGVEGAGPKGFLESLAEGLKAMGTDFGKIVKGTLALGLAAVAVVGPFAGALLIIKDVNPATIAAFSLGVGVLGTSLAVLGKMSSNVIKGGIALAAAGAGILAASYGFSLLEGVNPDVVKAVVGSLLVLGTGAAILGALSGNIITGAGALGILGLAMVPAAFAFSLLAGVDVESIIAFSVVLPLLGLAAAGLGFIAPLIGVGALALGALGLALIPLSMGFEKMASANVEGLVNSLQSLATAAPQLLGVAVGLGAISAGLASMAVTGLLALPVIGALTALGTVSGALSSIFGGEEGDKEDKGSMKAIEQKLDQLIAVISAGGDVYIDGAKVGKTVALATSRIG